MLYWIKIAALAMVDAIGVALFFCAWGFIAMAATGQWLWMLIGAVAALGYAPIAFIERWRDLR